MSGPSQEVSPGYAEIEAAGKLHPESGAWAFFMREIIRLPREMTPAVFQAIRFERWRTAENPLEAIRSAALEAHKQAWSRPGIPNFQGSVGLAKSR